MLVFNNIANKKFRQIKVKAFRGFFFILFLLSFLRCELYGAESTILEIESAFKYEIADHYNKKKYVRYEGIPHLFIPASNSDALLVGFHGAVVPHVNGKNGTPLPVFRFYNLKIANQPHILCFSDLLIESYEGIRLSWYLDTKKIKQRDFIEEVVRYYMEKYSIKHVLFFGTSGGGHIAIDMASRFNQVALIGNCQFNLREHNYFSVLAKILSERGDELRPFELRELLMGKKGPSKCLSYCNIDDYTIAHHIYLEQILNALFPGAVEPFYFSGAQIALEKQVHNHNVAFPDGIDAKSMLEVYFSQILD